MDASSCPYWGWWKRLCFKRTLSFRELKCWPKKGDNDKLPKDWEGAVADPARTVNGLDEWIKETLALNFVYIVTFWTSWLASKIRFLIEGAIRITMVRLG